MTHRPLLACECVECPSHQGERARLEAEVARLTLKVDQYQRQLDDRWAGVVGVTNDAVAANQRLTTLGDALAAAVEAMGGQEVAGLCPQDVFAAARAWRERRMHDLQD